MDKHDVVVISGSELPQIAVTNNVTAEFGDAFSLACNITSLGNTFAIKLLSIAWIKDGERVTELTRPAEQRLKAISRTTEKPEDGGLYQCELSAMLYQQRVYNITELIAVQGTTTRPHSTR